MLLPHARVAGSGGAILASARSLPDDSLEADERAAARQLRDVRARVKAARAAISANAGAEVILRRDWVKAAQFYAKFGIMKAEFLRGVAASIFARPMESGRENLVFERI